MFSLDYNFAVLESPKMDFLYRKQNMLDFFITTKFQEKKCHFLKNPFFEIGKKERLSFLGSMLTFAQLGNPRICNNITQKLYQFILKPHMFKNIVFFSSDVVYTFYKLIMIIVNF